jgi:ferrous iron transport protein B
MSPLHAMGVEERQEKRPVRSELLRVALIGNPNTGKTTVFNRLCGARAKTSNFPGTTTATRLGISTIGQRRVEVIDLPGLYQLQLDWPEAKIARDVLDGKAPHRKPDAVIAVMDASNLARNLVLVGELMAHGRPMVIGLNMLDVADRRGLRLNITALARSLGVPVVPMIASKSTGVDELRAALDAVLADPAAQVRPADLPPPSAPPEALAAWADALTAAVGGGSGPAGQTDRFSDRLDRFFTHPVYGTLVFLLVMGSLFWTLFEFATLPMALIGWIFARLGEMAQQFIPAGPLQALVTQGIIGGIAGTVVFLPQIALLFFLISLLEDTGYLARAAFVNDRIFCKFGLPGQAFVPLLTAHACALPGIMSTRLIPDRRDRLATILVLPFMSCSARLPVYVLLTSLLFATRPALAGLAFAGCYVLGAAAAFLTAALFGRTVLRGRPRPMMLELPTYKMPSFLNAVIAAKDQGLAFLKTAGTIIFAICVVMWWLSAYPRTAPPPEAMTLRAQAASAGLETDRGKALAAEADALESKAAQGSSYAGRIGRSVQVVFHPLGFDWQLTDGILTAFVAREVFVSTMSVLAGAGGSKDLKDAGVLTRIQTMARDDGTPVFTRATSASALVFFVLAMQCLATLTVTRKETGGLRYAALQLVYMSGLAYVAAFVVYQTLRAMGVN